MVVDLRVGACDGDAADGVFGVAFVLVDFVGLVPGPAGLLADGL